MRIIFLVLFMAVIGTACTITDANAASDRVCENWGADHHVPGYKAPDGSWVPARDIPGVCTRWGRYETTQQGKRAARTDEFMDKQNRLERDRAERERRNRR